MIYYQFLFKIIIFNYRNYEDFKHFMNKIYFISFPHLKDLYEEIEVEY